MLFASEDTVSQIQQIVADAKAYVDLQRDHLTLQSAEKMTRLFATVILVVILVVIGFVVLLFAGMSCAFWLSGLLNNMAAGFGIVTGVTLLLALLVYANRRAWIMVPMARHIIRLLAPVTTDETLDGLHRESSRVGDELQQCQTRLQQSVSALLSPTTQPQTRADRIVNMVHSSYNLMRGVEIGMAAVTTIRKMFRRR